MFNYILVSSKVFSSYFIGFESIECSYYALDPHDCETTLTDLNEDDNMNYFKTLKPIHDSP